MTDENCRDVLDKSERFYNEYKIPRKWESTAEEYYKICDNLIANLILIKINKSSPSFSSQAHTLIENITQIKTDYLTYWIDKMACDIKNLEKKESEVREEFKNFETKSIGIFTIVLAMLSFIISTVNGIEKSFSTIDILEIAVIYGFSVSLFAGFITLFSTSGIGKSIKGFAFILIAVILILIFKFFKGN